MSSNNRIFYACQGVAISNMGNSGTLPATALGAANMVHGVQSVSMTTTFNPEQAFELGQIEIYENIEGTPDVEVTMEKVIDGAPLLYHLASPKATSNGLVGRSKERCDVALGIWSDGYDYVGEQGAGNDDQPQVQIDMSGMYISSVSYSIPVDGMATESITLVGNHKSWLKDANTNLNPAGNNFGSDTPISSGLGGVQRRENVMLSNCVFPRDIHGVNGSGLGNGYDAGNKIPRVHFQSFNVSTDFSREDIMELGRKAPYYRATTFPIEVSCELEMIAVSGDFIGAYEYGDPALFDDDASATVASGNNTREEVIQLTLENATCFDLGSKNRLSSVSYGGGDATGGNVSITYSFTNFNDLDVLSSGDPALAANAGTMNYSPHQSGITGIGKGTFNK